MQRHIVVSIPEIVRPRPDLPANGRMLGEAVTDTASRRGARLTASGHPLPEAEHHRRVAAEAHEQLRELGNAGRHLYPWFERHEDTLGRGLAAELLLEAAHSAVYHVLGAPSIASLTAACLTSDRAIDIGRLERLVNDTGDGELGCPRPRSGTALRSSSSQPLDWSPSQV
jgi:hypothetical protein